MRRSRRKCPSCKKKGLFNSKKQPRCLNCLHKEQGHKLIPNPDKKSKVMWDEDIDWTKIGL